MYLSLNQCIFRLLFFFPLWMAIWWVLRDLQVEGFHALAEILLGGFQSSEAWKVWIRGNDVVYQFQNMAAGPSFSMDPLSLTRGLPLYLALMFSTQKGLASWGPALRGSAFILILALFGYSVEAALRLTEAHSAAEAFERSWISAASVQITTKFMVTRIVPVGLWVWQQRRVIEALAYGSRSDP